MSNKGAIEVHTIVYIILILLALWVALMIIGKMSAGSTGQLDFIKSLLGVK